MRLNRIGRNPSSTTSKWNHLKKDTAKYMGMQKERKDYGNLREEFLNINRWVFPLDKFPTFNREDQFAEGLQGG